jgi:hypothetical protein
MSKLLKEELDIADPDQRLFKRYATLAEAWESFKA